MAGDEPTHDDTMNLHAHGVTTLLHTHRVYLHNTGQHTGNGKPCHACMDDLLGNHVVSADSVARQQQQLKETGPIYKMSIPCTRRHGTAPIEAYTFCRADMEMPTRIMPADVPPPPGHGRFGGAPEIGNGDTEAINSSFTEAATTHLRTAIPFAESIAPTPRPRDCGPPGRMHEDEGAPAACTPGCATRCHASAFCTLAAGHTGHCDAPTRSAH